MSNQSGTLGKYQIIREIARSNDIVYEAYDPLMNRRVALKELAMPGGATPQQKEERIKRFLREARAAGTLAHPNIMTVYEAGEVDGRNYIAMEYLDGHTLRNEIDTHGFLPLDKAYEIGETVLGALEFAHKQGVIHRDIKPENIQLLTDGRIKLTDFGIARLTFEPNLTMDGQVFGTPSYMSPEQVVGREIDARSDLFSMGVVFYEMVAGQKPFTGDSVVSITYAIMNKEPERPTQANYALWQVLQRALEKSPQLRYPSAKDMLAALKAAEQAALQGPVLHMPKPPIVSAGPTGYPYAQANPYLTPRPGPNPYPNLAVPPNPAPYDPYQAQSAQALPPVTPGQAPIPIYYPPPPRTPLLKPETKVFLGKLFMTLVVMGAFLALIIVGVRSISLALERARLQQEDEAVVEKIQRQDRTRPVSARIREREGLISQLRSDISRAEQYRQLAVLYQEQGRLQVAEGRYTEAENSFNRAIELDRGNAALYTSLAALYGSQARGVVDVEHQVQLWGLATNYWFTARLLEQDRARKQTYDQGYRESRQNYETVCKLAGRSPDEPMAVAQPSSMDSERSPDLPAFDEARASQLLDDAKACAQRGDRSQALDDLYQARQLAPPGSDLSRQIADELGRLGR